MTKTRRSPAGRQPSAALAQSARRAALAAIDLDVVAANYRTLAQASAPGECAAIVKGDGYGLGMLPVARACWQAGARLYFVARFEDGMLLRAQVPDARIGVLDGLSGWPPVQFANNALVPVLGTPDDLRSWCAQKAPGPFMLQIDTGMNRLGVKPRDLAELTDLLRAHAKAIAAYLTHFASADDIDLDFCRHQAWRFEAALAGLPPAPRSIVNSSGLYLGVPEWRAAFTRPGKALAGINPLPAGEPSPVAFAMTVTAPILQVSEVARGDSIGYSATFRASRPMRIATLGIGYANGYLRALSNKGIVAFSGRRASIVGRVSMDLTTVDVTGIPDADLAAGYAEMLGPTIGLTELANLAGSNEYELQISLGRGCRRVYSGDGADG